MFQLVILIKTLLFEKLQQFSIFPQQRNHINIHVLYNLSNIYTQCNISHGSISDLFFLYMANAATSKRTLMLLNPPSHTLITYKPSSRELPGCSIEKLKRLKKPEPLGINTITNIASNMLKMN